jgi:3-oxocholest-4-en-26-oyl-CoA dehydrogenase alpha subunit
MEFDLPAEARVLRDEIRATLAVHWSRGLQWQADAGEAYEDECRLRRLLGERGWLTPHWPLEFGGGGRPFWETIVIAEELQYGGVHTGSTAVRVVGPTLMLTGTEAQKADFLPAIARGDIDFALGYTEPGAGSDLAALQTRAVRDGDSFVVNGGKIFTSMAHRAEYCWLAARTEPDAPKHRGISLFIVDLKTPGITVRPLHTMAGGRTNATYWDNVRVPADALVGEPNRGWYYMTAALDLERLAYYTPGTAQYLAERFIDYLRGTSGAVVRRGPRAREAAVRSAMEALVNRLLYRRATWMVSEGTIPNYEASMTKLFATELEQRIPVRATAVLGPLGQLTPEDADAPIEGLMELEHRHGVYKTFGGGSSELMRNIIATRGMGLPRA